MITFLYEKGHISGKTMTVKELIDELSKLNENDPVVINDEGRFLYIYPDNITKFNKEDYWHSSDKEYESLILIETEEWRSF